jgi:hypothetical protein
VDFPQAEVGEQIALREIAPAAGNFADLRDAACYDPDAGTHGVAVAFDPDQAEVHEVVFTAGVIVEDGGRVAVICDDDVHETVVVEIGKGGAPSSSGRKIRYSR